MILIMGFVFFSMYSPMIETMGELNPDLNTEKNTCGTLLSS